MRLRFTFSASAEPLYIPLAGPLALFALGALLGQFASYDPLLGLRWLIWLCAGLALYVAIVLQAYSADRLLRVAAAPVLAAALEALVLAAQYRHLGWEVKFGAVSRLGALASAPFPSLLGFYIGANAAAATLEGALPLALGLALAQPRRRVLWLGCAALIGGGVLLTGSRGAWVALGCAALIGLPALLPALTRVPARRWAVAAAIVAALALLTVSAFVASPGGQRVLAAAAYRAHDRLTLYRNSFFLALDFPLTGIGPGDTFALVYSRFQLLIGVPYLTYAHNLLLAVWLAQGLIGLVGFIALALAFLRVVWRALCRRERSPAYWVCWGAAVACATLLLHGATDAPQYDAAWPALLMAFALLGVAAAAARLIDARPVGWVQSWRAIAPGAAALALVLVLSLPQVGAAAQANVSAMLHTRAALSPLLGQGERAALREQARSWAERASTLDPASVSALKRRGLLALDDGDFATAVVALEIALRAAPADQSLRKALGYAYIWNGRAPDGVALLATLDRTAEVRAELDVWPYAWNERGRDDLAERARQAASLLHALPPP